MSVFSQYDDANYLHYWGENIGENYNLLLETKQKIIESHIQTLSFRKAQLKAKAVNLDMTAQDAEAVLNGTVLKGVGSAIESSLEEKTEDNSVEITDVDMAEKIINTNINSIQNVGQFLDLLNNYLDSLPSNLKIILDGYSNALLEEWSNSTRAAVMKTYGNASEQIFASLMGRYRQDMFKVPGDEASNGMSTSLLKLKQMVNSLPVAVESGNSFIVRHQGESVGTKVGEESELVQQAMVKTKGWLRQMYKELAEISKGVAFFESHKPLVEKIEDVHGSFEHTGSKNFNVNFKPDPSLELFMNKVQVGLSRMTGKKVAKSDFGFYIGDKKVGAFAGVNAKNYNTNFTPDTTSFTFKVQDETPLITLLIRECEYGEQDLHNIYQIATASYRNETTNSSLNSIWNEIIENVKYRALLAVLAGLDTSIDQSYYMAINGRFFTMGSVLQHIKDTASVVTMRSVAGSKQDNAVPGLKRDTYVQMNRRNFQKNPRMTRIENALRRSDITNFTTSQIMYNTKIRTEIRLTELSILMQEAL